MLSALPVAARPSAGGEPARGGVARTVRDAYGVPHVYADTPEQLYRGWGYALAQDRLWQLEVTRASVWGRVAELYGPGSDGQYVEYDRLVRESYEPAEQVEAEIAALPAEAQALLREFATGINKAIHAARLDPENKLPYEFHRLGVRPRKWTAADVAQVWIGTLALRYGDGSAELDNAALLDALVAQHGPIAGAEIFDDLLPLEVSDSPVTCPEAVTVDAGAGGRSPLLAAGADPERFPSPACCEGVAAVAERERGRRELTARVLGELGLPDRLGSYMWMARSSAGEGVLVGGPQMGFGVPGYLHEVGLHLEGPEGLDLVGSTPAGDAAVLFGYNGSIAWSATSGAGNVADVFVLQLVGDDWHYLHDGQVLPMQRRSETILVRGGPPVTVDVYRSLYGPVFDWQAGTAYTRRRSWEGLALQSWHGWVEMGRAATFEEFTQAAGLVALPVNWGYADRNGQVGFVHCGRFPILHPEVDPRLPTIGTGERDWQGMRPFSWNPQCLGDRLVNWNNRPAPGYPIGDRTAGHHWNTIQRAAAIEEALDTRPNLTFEEMPGVIEEIGFLHTEAAALASSWIDWLGSGMEPRLQEAADRMAAWSRSYADDDGDGWYDDPGLTLWEAWMGKTVANVLEDELGDYAKAQPAQVNLVLHVFQGDASAVPLSRDYLNGLTAEQVLRQALQGTLSKLEARYGTPDMDAWLTTAERHHFATANSDDIPVAEVPVRDLRLKMNRGSENHIVGLGPDQIRALDVVPPGESGFVSRDGRRSDHYEDQLDLFEDLSYKEMPLAP